MDKTIWMISDTHFFHDRDFIWRERGFISVDEMNETIIERWNEVIKDDDIVYHLGDVLLGGAEKLEVGIELLKRLKGHKYLAYGNHDTDNRIQAFKDNNLFEDIQMGYRIKYHKKMFICTHYPTIVDNFDEQEHKNVFNLCGHSHTPDPFLHWSNGCYHVEVDAHYCYPINFEDIMADIKKEEHRVLY